MKKITFSLFFSVLFVAIFAQQPYFPIKSGLVLTSTSYNTKGKVESISRQTIVNVSGANGTWKVEYEMEILDAKGAVSKQAGKEMKFVMTQVIEKNNCIVDMKDLFANILQPFMEDESTRNAVEVSGDPIVIPYKLKEGDILPDANCDIKIGFMKINCKITDNKCLGFETITVPAGTFNCRKISQTTTVKAMGMNETNTTIQWEAEGVGTVKAEIYDKKGKLNSYSELTEIK
jgi:hypothetical protein